MISAAFEASAARMEADPLDPISPWVKSMMAVLYPCFAALMRVPEQVSSTSSRWAATASRSTVVMSPIYLGLMPTGAITRRPSPLLEQGERTHIGRDPISFERALKQHDDYRAALAEL